MTQVDIAEISLIIDDKNRTSFKISLSNSDEEKLSTICSDISLRYHLSAKATEKIYQQVLTEITNVRNGQYSRNRPPNQNSSNEIVNRLYYEGTKRKKALGKANAMKLQEKINTEMALYSFSPKADKGAEWTKQRNNSRKRRDISMNAITAINSGVKEKNKSGIGMINGKNAPQLKPESDLSEKFYCDLRTTSTKALNGNSQLNSHKPSHLQKTHSINLNAFNRSSKKPQLSMKTIQLNYIQTILTSPKTEKSSTISTSNCFDRLHSTQSLVQQKKQEMINRFYELQCPFEPKLSKGSLKLMKKRKESPLTQAKRLASSKVYSSISKSIHSINLKTEPSRSTIHKSLSFTTNKTIHKQSSSLSLGQCPESKGKRIAQQRSERNIYQALTAIEQRDTADLQYYTAKANRNAERYKLTTLRSIYDLISKEAAIDFNALPSNGIPKHIVDKVVIPACYTITNKKLPFSFETFYLIASDLLSNYC